MLNGKDEGEVVESESESACGDAEFGDEETASEKKTDIQIATRESLASKGIVALTRAK